jgi:hypothetical protein
LESHLDSKIVLSEDSKYRNLYSWFLLESGDNAVKSDRCQVPWEWTLYFTLADIILSSSFSIESSDGKSTTRETIEAKLVPNDARNTHFRDDTAYSMLGTNRLIKDFRLHIREVSEGGEENCSVWGCVSYTAEVDFRDVRSDDIVIFYLWVTRERFDQYAQVIRYNAITHGLFKVGRVAGFYSEWSPAVSTSSVKVLTADKNFQPVEMPDGCLIDPPRLRKVGEFELQLYRDIKFKIPAEVDATGGSDRARVPIDVNTSKPIMFPKSIIIAAWLIVMMLFLILMNRSF